MKKPAPILPVLVLTFGSLSFPAPSGPQAGAPPQKPNAIPVKYSENAIIPETVRSETFKLVWETVRDEYYDPTFGGKDWGALGEKYRPLAADAKKSGEFHSVLKKMLAELGRSHLAVSAPHEASTAKPVSDARFLPEGITLCVADGRIAVASVSSDSPAWSAGLRPGAVLLKTGESPLPTLQDIRKSTMRALISARNALAGPAESTVDLKFLDGEDRERTISLPRTKPYQERANLGKSIFEYRRVDPRVGYMRFDGWAFDLKSKLEAALKDLGDSDGLIIDCRQNRGGVNPGVDFLSKSLCAEPAILAVLTPRNGERQEWKHEGSGPAAYQGRVAILIDDGSGSASEVFAGVMQEKGRAIVLGRTSYGGVLNSTQLPLPTGGILQYPHSGLTTAKGRVIEGIGIIPDIQVEISRADLLQGRDTVVERAVAEILGRR